LKSSEFLVSVTRFLIALQRKHILSKDPKINCKLNSLFLKIKIIWASPLTMDWLARLLGKVDVHALLVERFQAQSI
jgi:hypothetical protein